MPELPEVETICRALKPLLEGESFLKIQANRPNLRYPLPVNLDTILKNKAISLVNRRAKYLLLNFSNGLTLVWHLGMSGRVIIENLNAPPVASGPHDHVVFTTSHDYKITFRDPRRFGFLLLYPTNQISSLSPFNLLGPEPLGETSITASVFHATLKRRTIPVKNALLDQKIIAGLGNIYASEALWQARLSPQRLANTLTLKETEILLTEIQNVLRRAISAGGSTLRDYAQPNGDTGYFQHAFKVYNRE
ncbi:MAG TPA: bifunctional DNA-formamidopyrimidine glycosylase/DNA-(apurinic or apyrimidinic site) lyase, partial [Gammaproteobacteria bacterium]|nr:bifunctional DNA-formamidopyrimidine glycosylase/DNA-(apurinic or apyrimidinic site) lyase [Gammaproteobacteria bacterium]